MMIKLSPIKVLENEKPTVFNCLFQPDFFNSPEIKETVEKVQRLELETKIGQKTKESVLDDVNVRRLLQFVKRELNAAISQHSFEPNDVYVRQMIKDQLEEFLHRKMINDFIVVCDETNNRPDSIRRGELVVDMAVKPTKSEDWVYMNATSVL